MDRLIKFCLPLDLQVWLDQYKAPTYESAFAKDIPNSWHNHQMASRLAKVVKIRKKYRGGSWVDTEDLLRSAIEASQIGSQSMKDNLNGTRCCADHPNPILDVVVFGRLTLLPSML